jgi:ribosomal protein S18 acetylase RimI-like enzyme
MFLMEIVDFRPELAPTFKALNEAWITTLFALEPKDREVLDDPQGKIIARGGQVLFVADTGEIVGCVALMKLGDGGFEVAKMAVADSHKGRGLGRALMAACVERARAAGAPRLYLETNSALAPAMALYRGFGFRELTGMKRGPSDYARVDVWMELSL